MKVVNINNTPSGQQSGENVIDRLETALAMAKDGHVKNCIVICALNDGDVADCWANGSDPFVMVGAIEAVKREFIDCCIEERE